jgi:hypothetical protein
VAESSKEVYGLKRAVFASDDDEDDDDDASFC